MTTQTAVATTPSTTSRLTAAMVCAMIGLGMVMLAGHVQSAALHEAAHDARHAAGFPCH